jgi:hypothetical protein
LELTQHLIVDLRLLKLQSQLWQRKIFEVINCVYLLVHEILDYVDLLVYLLHKVAVLLD